MRPPASCTLSRVTDVVVEREPAQSSEKWLGLEVLAVLGFTYFLSALAAILDYSYDLVRFKGHISQATANVVTSNQTDHPIFDFLFDAYDLLHDYMPVFVVLLLIARNPGGPGFGIGFDLREKWRDLAHGAGFAALIGLPGLGLVWIAHELGANAHIAVVDFPNVWYRVPYLVLEAFQNGLAEEVVVTAFLLTRLRQLGWSNSRALGAEALLRGTYHLYQGWGAFFGNAVMGVIFGWWFQRTRRVQPLVIAHFLIDAVSFVGYVYLHNHISWI